MAVSTKKGNKSSKAKPRGTALKKSHPKPKRDRSLQSQLAEALEQQAATSDILRMIARAPADLQAVLNAIAESAASLCDAADAILWRVDTEFYRLAGHFGPIRTPLAVGEGNPITRDTPASRAIVDRKTIHVHDLKAAESEFPLSKHRGIASGLRTVLVTPLLRDGVAIGSIQIRRTEVRPFTESQIKLLETFADQAVIAIENARLIHEQQASNRNLAEALQQQTATSDILRVIASSPTDIQPVLDTVAENAARLCNANETQIFRFDGAVLRLAANYGGVPASSEMPLTRGGIVTRSFVDRQTVHVHDPDELATEFPARRSSHRTFLATPLLREGVPLGVIGIRRNEMRPFSETQIKLLETFADQAVIAIENVRLFQELTESLEQQTATSEILGVIASSPTDIKPVLDAVAATAARLCDARDALIDGSMAMSLST